MKILISDPLNEAGIYPLREKENFEVMIKTGQSPEQLEDIIPTIDAWIVRSQTQVTRRLIEKAKNLKIIARAGVGVDNIDQEAATENGIIIVNAPYGNTNSAAEHTIAMLMALTRNIPQAYFSLKNGKWDRNKYVGTEVKNKTLGIIGLGKIGAEVAFRAKGQRMDIIAYDPFLTREKADQMGVTYGTFEEVISKADFLTLHTPLVKETKHMINREAFGKMKPGVRIINCSRGGVIDEDALYEAILSKKVAGAAIDVLEEEPFTNHPLLELKEVIATPHLGASTVEAQEMVAVDVSHDVVNFLEGNMVKNPVNLPSIPPEIRSKVQPYFPLSEKLGQFVAHLPKTPAKEIHITYAGELKKIETTPLTRNIVKGILKPYLGERVNDVNAEHLAARRGIIIHESKSSTAKGFTNLITAEIISDSEKRTVSGTLLNGLGARIVKSDGYSIDIPPVGHLVYIRHQDQPGVIGKVGHLLGEHDINIATMQVDRSDVGGKAIMLLKIDKHLDDNAIQALRLVPVIEEAIAIDL
jgi:D-3-phosphoglycerate dehydrogenase